MSFAEFLTQDQVERIHEASLEILEEVGLRVRYEPARAMFEKHGCLVDGERVKLPRAVVEKYRKMCPPTFTFYARDPKFDRISSMNCLVMICSPFPLWQMMRRRVNLRFQDCILPSSIVSNRSA